MPTQTLKGLPPTAKRLWERIFKQNKTKLGADSAARVAWSAVKKLFKKEGDRWVKKGAPKKMIGRSENFEFSSEKLVCRSEMGDISNDYFVEGYIATPEPNKKDGYILTTELLEELDKQIKEMPISIKGDIDHINTKIARGQKINTSEVPTLDNILKLEESRVDEKGLWGKFKVDKYSDAFPKVWGRIKEGFYDAFSIELYAEVGGSDLVSIEGEYLEKIKKGRIKKVSLTGQPKDTHSTITKAYQT